MLPKVLLCILHLLVIVKSNQDYSTLVKNNITYKIYPYGIYRLTDISIPVLQKGSITGLDDVITLQIFNIQLNEIQPEAFKKLPKLTYLEVSFNDKLEEIKRGVFNDLQNLTALALSNNNISIIASDAFDNMTKLEEVSLLGNNLRQWDPKWFFNTSSLVYISANRNPFEEFGANAFKNFASREDAFYFYFNGCGIRKIDDNAFKGVGRIGVLSLDENKLDVLSGRFLRNVEVAEVHVKNNQIRCQVNEDFEAVFAANVTYIGGNPWDPNCMNRIRAWLQTFNGKVVVIE